MLLRGKRIIVVGGASGIAAETVRAYVEHGAAVLSLDVDDERGREVVASATGPGSATYLHCDVADRAAVDAVFAEGVALLGGLDVLAMVAGVEQQKQAQHVTPADVERIVGTNFGGTLNTNAAAFAHLCDRGGSIINYSSAAGLEGAAGMPLYSAAKGAVLAFTRSVARDWGRYGIRVNAVCPAIVTPMLRTFLAGMDPELRRSRAAATAERFPLGGGPGSPREAADVNVFLASDLARFVTGQTLPVDGGNVMVR
ncbi:SDR family NAD(P)-dependent oxidoreductase [Pseudonocardia pini]|uniref:SDR family NAD(P)-dependent oxidoreductase n=1 Tax=Pseudonocardia pini TaxID=2758030 RepID=UPI0015F04CFE|nr:SDR family NAD(P)-dependent oxidoreductase [Pseudonocardia pini]